jgi:hypothetical protein
MAATTSHQILQHTNVINTACVALGASTSDPKEES